MDRFSEEDFSISPANCLRAMAERVDGEDPLSARFCRYSKLMSPLVMEGVAVEGVCMEECGHEAVLGVNDDGRVHIINASFDTPE
jgi:hypothetical protein